MVEMAQVSLSMQLTGNFVNQLQAGSAQRAKIRHEVQIIAQLLNGAGADQANFLFGDDERSLAGSATEDLDLYDLGSFDIGAGAGKDAFGQTPALAKLVAFIIRNSPESVGDLLVGGKAAATAFNSWFNGDDDALIVLPPGAAFMIIAPAFAGYAIADTSNHLLKIAASAAGAVTYSFALAARKA